MTAALNLGLLGNNVNTSGQVSLTAGVSGTLPVANGGTGLTTPGTSGNVLQSNGTTWTSAAAPVVIPSSITAIGTILLAAVTTTSNYLPGDTIAGSNLYYPTVITSTVTYIHTNGTGYPTPPYTIVLAGFQNRPFGGVLRASVGNTGYQVPLGHTALSGTWRVLTVTAARSSSYSSCFNETSSQSSIMLAQRIS